MKVSRLILTLTAAVALAGFSSPKALALSPLAGFVQQGSTLEFTYDSGALNTADATFDSSATVDFSDLSGLFGGNQPLTMTLSGTRLAGAGGDAADLGPLSVQNVVITSISFKDGATNVLTMTADTGLLLITGPTGNGPTGGISGDNTSGGTVTYSSDLVSSAILNGGTNSYSWSLDSITPPVTEDGGVINIDFTSFSSTISGLFSYTPTNVPEPGAVAMLIGMGVSGSLFVIRRRRS